MVEYVHIFDIILRSHSLSHSISLPLPHSLSISISCYFSTTIFGSFANSFAFHLFALSSFARFMLHSICTYRQKCVTRYAEFHLLHLLCQKKKQHINAYYSSTATCINIYKIHWQCLHHHGITKSYNINLVASSKGAYVCCFFACLLSLSHSLAFILYFKFQFRCCIARVLRAYIFTHLMTHSLSVSQTELSALG